MIFFALGSFVKILPIFSQVKFPLLIRPSLHLGWPKPFTRTLWEHVLRPISGRWGVVLQFIQSFKHRRVWNPFLHWPAGMHLHHGTDEIGGNRPLITSSQSSSVWQKFCTNSDMIEIIISRPTGRDERRASRRGRRGRIDLIIRVFFFFILAAQHTSLWTINIQLFIFDKNPSFIHLFYGVGPNLPPQWRPRFSRRSLADRLPDPFHTELFAVLQLVTVAVVQSRPLSRDSWLEVKKRCLIEVRGRMDVTKPLSVGTFVYVITVRLLIGHDSLIIRGQFVAFFIIFP